MIPTDLLVTWEMVKLYIIIWWTHLKDVVKSIKKKYGYETKKMEKNS